MINRLIVFILLMSLCGDRLEAKSARGDVQKIYQRITGSGTDGIVGGPQAELEDDKIVVYILRLADQTHNIPLNTVADLSSDTVTDAFMQVINSSLPLTTTAYAHDAVPMMKPNELSTTLNTIDIFKKEGIAMGLLPADVDYGNSSSPLLQFLKTYAWVGIGLGGITALVVGYMISRKK
ncbi:MAG: hypothetical protein LBI20_00685 [Holosporales bacterium]|jgi:hypothetical protein|nr:hypothetical protein [Holosporales bacterium]